MASDRRTRRTGPDARELPRRVRINSLAAVTRRIRRALPDLPAADVKDLAGSVERLVQALQPESIYVFGSQARRTATEDSDVDLMVIVPASEHATYRRAQRAFAAVGEHRVPLDILVWTRKEFDERLPAPTSLPAIVTREGHALYAA
jgi:predicted nucleotidyltransferase